MLEEYLKLEFWNNTAKDYLIATGIIVIGILIVRIFKKTLLQKIKSLTEKTSTNFDDYLVAAIEKFVIPALYISIVFLASGPFQYLMVLGISFPMHTR